MNRRKFTLFQVKAQEKGFLLYIAKIDPKTEKQEDTMKTELLICLTLCSLYTTGCLSGTTGKTEPTPVGTSDPSIPWGSPLIISKTELQRHRADFS